MWLQSVHVLPGQEDFWVPVRATSPVHIHGFQLLVQYDPARLAFRAHSFTFTPVEALDPEFVEVVDNDSFIEVGCLFDFSLPLTNKRISPPTRDRVMHLRFDVRSAVTSGTVTRLSLEDDLELSQVRNILTVEGGRSIQPRLRGARVEVVSRDASVHAFVRGDTNDDSVVDLSDALVVLNYLFLQGPEPRCLDAADFSDEGNVSLTSVLSLLNFLFLRGAPPEAPAPNPGFDPTRDELHCR